MTPLNDSATPQSIDGHAEAAVVALLDGLDITVVHDGPATASRKCSTDNGCDTLAGSDC
ncbi:hypothetical protein [Actinomadura flavalba]|uniref:hypothetical protein n=1 Tax=Actinomadura flavalba TaxID=1120938 RepID=UPI0003653950|nr:hypothetical protein [Actinomadura flavalba]